MMVTGFNRSQQQSSPGSDSDYSEDNMCSVVGTSHAHMGFQSSGRTRRRGAIEKRRRDRINNSLNELKRLVPTALEKSGTAKLEKAEILQMTVDHMKVLHSKGLNNLSYDPKSLARDYHSFGFRECANEVIRYLASMEGMDTENPLRLRLTSHLQMLTDSRVVSSPYEQASGAQYCPPPSQSWGYPPHQQLPTSVQASEAAASSAYFPADGITPSQLYPSPYFAPSSSSTDGQGGQSQTTYTPPTAATNSTYIKQQPYRPWRSEMSC